MPALLSIADEVLKLRAVCACCGEPAYVSHRLSEEEGQVVVGAKEKYEALCRKCYLYEIKKEGKIKEGGKDNV